MRTLYVTQPGTLLRLDNQALVVEQVERPPQRVLLGELHRIVAWGGVSLSTPLLRALGRRGIDVALLTQSGRYTAAVIGSPGAGLASRLAQFRRALDAGASLNLARGIVADKLASAAALMRGVRKRAGPDALLTCIRTLDDAGERVGATPDLDALRGIEGAAARAYFDHFGLLVPEPFTFTGRNRQPPRDPINALLSFGYTLLANEVRGDLEARGLDPRLGFLHAVRPGRPALALDLMEPWRAPVVDRLVLTLVRRRVLAPGDFERRGEACLLDDRGRRVFLDAWEAHLGDHESQTALRRRIAAFVDGFEDRLLAGEPK